MSGFRSMKDQSLFVAVLAAFAFIPGAVIAQDTASDLGRRAQEALGEAIPATVQVTAVLGRLNLKGLEEDGKDDAAGIRKAVRFIPVGTGAIISSDGEFLTNAHVVEALDQLR